MQVHVALVDAARGKQGGTKGNSKSLFCDQRGKCAVVLMAAVVVLSHSVGIINLGARFPFFGPSCNS